ncbi:MAG: hypothetical protein RLZZ367_614 [Bacteroidota bacterium]|jgi:hypothetical protein
MYKRIIGLNDNRQPKLFWVFKVLSYLALARRNIYLVQGGMLITFNLPNY